MFLCFGNRDAVRNYASFATVVRIGSYEDQAVDFFMTYVTQVGKIGPNSENQLFPN